MSDSHSEEMKTFDATAIAIREDCVMVEYEDGDDIKEVAYDFPRSRLHGSVNRSVHVSDNE